MLGDGVGVGVVNQNFTTYLEVAVQVQILSAAVL